MVSHTSAKAFSKLRPGEGTGLVSVAYRQYGYRLDEIAMHRGVHYATISRCMKQAEQETNDSNDPTPPGMCDCKT